MIHLKNNCNYIWDKTNPSIGLRSLIFKREFKAKQYAEITLFADTFYTIIVNNKEIGFGPILTSHQHPYLSKFDLSTFLNDDSENNIIIVEVWFDGRNPHVISDADPYKGGLIASIETDIEHIVTDNNWKVKENGIYTPAREEKRTFGGKRVMIADFNGNSEWEYATEYNRYDDKNDIDSCISPPFNNFTCARLDMNIIDLGISRCKITVNYADDVSEKMIKSELESFAVTSYGISVLTTESNTIAHTLPDKNIIKNYTDGKIINIPYIDDSDFYVTFDARRQTSGSLWIDIENDEEVIIDIGYADHLIKGRVDPTLQSHPFADRIIIPSGQQKIHLPFDKGYRFIQCNFSKKCVINDIYVSEHVYNHDDKIRFNSSDKVLNTIWQGALDTLHQCSLSMHVDNARRERQGWGGPDIFGMSHGVFYGFGDTKLTKKTLIDTIYCFNEHGFIPQWYPAISPGIKWISAHDLWYSLTVWDYIFHSDDRDLAKKLLPITKEVINFYCSVNDGELNTKPYSHACRWEEWSLNVAQDISTWENILAVISLQSIAKLEEYLGLDCADSLYRADKLNKAIFKRLWHPHHNALCQGTKEDSSLVDHAGQLENAVALLYGLVPEDKKQDVYDFCSGKSGMWPTSRSGWQGAGQGERTRYNPNDIITAGTPFSSSICAKVINRFHSSIDALYYIKHNFGEMLEECDGTFGEMWPVFIDEMNASTCFSQGYNGAITSTIITDVLGLRFTAPGGKKIEWHLLKNALEMIEGEIETVYGTVSVKRTGEDIIFNVPNEIDFKIIRY